ncbi:uncharacterized protein LOC115662154 isoform X2 [Syzygium oleosum]|uniref:uncharacterized protein LOC115662154 isoform X2 n=1 Tax=Syzygium oleosum TaxID=219896 RepID=UPI0024BBC07D|nr:uncharacterized protein LOC115662154 isoform X2 [Syzygium oleosum]
MTRKRDRFWEYAEQLSGRFKCKFCRRDFPGGIPRVKSHLACVPGRDVAICTEVPKDVQAIAFEAISPHNRKDKSLSQPTTSTRLADIQIIDMPETSTDKGQDCLDELLAKHVVFNNISENVLQSSHFASFLRGVANYGQNYELPSYSVLTTKYIPKLNSEVVQYVNSVKKSCDLTGCTVILDSWVNVHGRAFLNIILYSLKGVILVNTVELPKNELTYRSIVDQLQFVMDEIGLHKVVQFITNDLGNHQPLQKMLIQRYSGTYMTFCAAHGIQLLFTYIFQEVEWVGRTTCEVKLVNDNLHKYAESLSLSVKFGAKRGLGDVLPNGLASNFRMLQCIHNAKSEIQRLVTSTEWRQLSLKEGIASKVISMVESPQFWSQCQEVLQVLEPLFEVYCLSRNTNPTISYLYEAMERVKESLKRLSDNNDGKYECIWKLYNGMRAKVIHPVHAAAAFLNPSYFLSDNFHESQEMKDGIDYVLQNMVAEEEQEAFMGQVLQYRKRESNLLPYAAKTMSKASHPYEWWEYCGDGLPVLQKYVLLILSQPCSSFSCLECRNASETTQITKSSELPVGKVDDSVYLRANTLMMDKFRMLESGPMKPINFAHLRDNHDDYVELEQDWKYNSANTVPESRSRGDIDGASTYWFPVHKLPALKGKPFKLRFMTSLPPHLFTEAKVQGHQGTAIQVALLNPETGEVVQSGPGSTTKLKIVVFDGDVEKVDWTREQLESHLLSKGCENRKPLLSGDLLVTLEGGIGTLGDFTFTQDSSWTKSGKYRLGVKVSWRCSDAVHIHGTISEAFTVEDSRGEFAKKRVPLLLSDYVWRLVGIAMGGQVHKQLTGAGIVTVQDFLALLSRDQLRLINITGGGISNAMWKHTLEHAMSCVSDAKQYVYYCNEGQSNAILFNWNYELKGLICNGQFLDMESLSSDQKIYLESMSKIAYQNYDQISEYCGNMFDFDSMTSSNSMSAFTSDDTTLCYVGCSFGTHQNLQQFVFHEAGNIENCLQATVSDTMSSMSMAARSASMTSDFPVQGDMLLPWNEQHLENVLIGTTKNWKPRKAAVEWLKLKAAFRWAITIRKMAATRRAKELECLGLIIPLMLQP